MITIKTKTFDELAKIMRFLGDRSWTGVKRTNGGWTAVSIVGESE